MNTFNNLNHIIQILQQNAVTIGITLCGLVFVIYVLRVLLDHDQSPAARSERWAKVGRAFLCAFLITGFVAVIKLAQFLGGQL